MKALHHRQKGFTLIELLVTIGILGVLAAVVVPNVGRFVGSGETQGAATELKAVQAAVDSAMADNGLTAVTAQALAVTNFATLDLIAVGVTLYPNYIRQDTAGRVGGYTWTANGQVTQAGSWK